MIISGKKPFDEVLKVLGGYTKIFLVGCKLCATVCQTGGEKEVLEVREELESTGKEVVGFRVVDAVCHLLETKKELAMAESEIKQADAILSLSCGAGSQALVSCMDVPVFTAVDTMFSGIVERWGRFSEVCSTCGDCVLNFTGGICPVTRCPKGILNGPCGGVRKGKCETDPERDCVWVQIYEHLKKQGRLTEFRRIFPPRDHAKNKRPGSLVLSRYGNETKNIWH